MTKQKHNISTIAEILIDKIESLSKDATRLEKSTEEIKNTTVKIDPHDINNLINVMNQKIDIEKDILSQFKALSEEKSSRVPNWLVGSLIAGFTIITIVLTAFILQLAK